MKPRPVTDPSLRSWRDLLDAGPEAGRFLSWPDVRALSGLSRTTAWRLMRRGEFPSPYRLSPNRVAYSEVELQAWKRWRIALRRDRGGPSAGTAPSGPPTRPAVAGAGQPDPSALATAARPARGLARSGPSRNPPQPSAPRASVSTFGPGPEPARPASGRRSKASGAVTASPDPAGRTTLSPGDGAMADRPQPRRRPRPRPSHPDQIAFGF
ncbi:helix-turn-helix transcriptional regulator [Brevundimonas bacteroides]|uniref:helix-turn-helix transcriptional regulator n=1 Tax=Brevundimonas bacteroides TaxID=74311 RepID=UPI000A02E48B|nr:AlpA family phage regulatory protein [Brevundimonas bacteroides]